MSTLHVKLTGIAPLLMHADTLANPLHPLKKRMAEITKKKKKTDEDIEAIAQIEWRASLYYDPDTGIHMPAVNLERMICDAAKLQKRGQDVKRGITVIDDMPAIRYEGPREPDALYRHQGGAFVDTRSVRNQQSKVMRTRAIFRSWALEFDASVDNEVLNDDELKSFITVAGRLVGLGDFRPRFGKFTAEFS